MEGYRTTERRTNRCALMARRGHDGVSVSAEDTPEEGGMIACNPANPTDKWYVAKDFFEANYVPA